MDDLAVVDASHAAMPAWQVTEWGELAGVALAETSVPRPKPGEILVAMSHAGVNFMDVYTARGAYRASKTYPMTLPVTLGVEGAGTVAALGEGVAGPPIGARVCFCLHWGAFAPFCSVPASRIVAVPDGVNTATAAAATFQGITAHYLANDIRTLVPGDWALVTSGAGGVARLLIQMLVHRGVRVVATTSSDAKANAAREAGAELALRVSPDLPAEVREATGGGVAIAYDSSGQDTLLLSLASLRRRGSLVLVGTNGGPVRSIEVADLMDAGSISFLRPRLADFIAGKDEYARRVGDVLDATARGELRAEPAAVRPFAAAKEELEKLVDRTAVGKSVLAMPGQ